jgi:hypothetical protein
VIGRLLAAYLGWAAAAALAFWALMSLHALAMWVYAVLRLSIWGVAAYQNVVFIVLIIAWLCWVVATEYWLRTSAGREQLRPTLLRVLAPVAVLALVSFGILQTT